MNQNDFKARQRALDPGGSFCVTAPAGSGKTELLTQRILALLPTVNRPEKVLAITFTRKAAAEMRERLLTKLDEARCNTPVEAAHEEQTRALALAALSHAEQLGWSLDPEQFNLRTIDSLCADLVRQMPVLSGLGGATEVSEQDQPLFEQAVAQLFDDLGSQTSAGADLRGLLLHFNNDWEALRRLLVALLARRGDWARSLGQHDDPEAANRALLETVDVLVASVVQRLVDEFKPWLDELEALAQFAAGELGESEVDLGATAAALDSWQRLAHLLLTAKNEWRKPGGVTIKSGFPPKSEEKRRLQSLLEEFGGLAVPQTLLELRALPVVSETDTSWQLVLRLSRLLPVLQAQLLLVFQRQGRVDFTHIALAAAEALGTDEEPTDLAMRLDYQIEHLLVDEFQDTSTQQFELLTRITRGWADHNASGNAPRTAFIVGDGMQSIYGFRYANVGLFLEAKRSGLGDLPLEHLELTQNFRSQAGVVAWVNRVFAQILPHQDAPDRGEVSHTGAVPVHAPLPGDAVSVQVFVAEDDTGAMEATWLAHTVATLRRDDPEATVAVLVRARSHVDELIGAFQQRGLSFVARDLQKIQHSPAVMDLLSLARWLANPADNVAALALLRAPFCGLRLGDIHNLLETQPRPFSLRAALRQARERLAPQVLRRTNLLLSALDWAESRRDRLALPVWMEQVWLRLQGPQTLSTRGSADALRFFELLRQAEKQGIGLDPDWLDQSLSRLYAGHDPVGAKVEVMTLHKAKGLQFDYVFMPALERGVGGNRRELLRWHYHSDGPQSRLLIAADDRQKEGPTLYNYLNWIQKQREAAEMRRLLYVGVTRARKRVWLTGYCKPGSEEGVALKWPGESTPLGILKDVVSAEAEIHLPPVRGASAEDESGDRPEPPSVFPSLWRLPAEHLTLAPESNDVASDAASGKAADTRLATAVPARGNAMERLIGLTVHRALELLSLRPELPASVDDGLRGTIAFALRGGGLAGDRLAESTAAVEQMLNKMLADPRGRWILAQHPDAYSELELATLGPEDTLTVHVIDRTFLDRDTDERWVIDYKTSSPSPGETEAEFFARESDHYASQLTRYRGLLREFDPVHREIRAALYFPAHGFWIQVD